MNTKYGSKRIKIRFTAINKTASFQYYYECFKRKYGVKVICLIVK